MKKFTQALIVLEERLLSYPKTLVFFFCIICGFSFYYSLENLGIDTDTTKILSPDLPFQKDRQLFLQEFPQDDQAILVVVDGHSPEQITRVLSYLGSQFRNQKQHFESIYIPGEGAFFEKNGLLYLGLDEINELADKLSEAQPFISALAKENSLKSLFSILSLAITTQEYELPVDLNPLLNKVREAIRAVIKGQPYSLSWQQLMLGDSLNLLATRRFILLKPILDFSELMPAEKPLQSVINIVENTKKNYPGIKIRLTGEVVLEHEELESVQNSAELASFFSMVLVFVALLISFRSVRLTIITLIVLVMGLILTAGFATFAIGHLNLISIAFSVLYIGIGVDYAIQMTLRYQELLKQNFPKKQALLKAVQRVAPAITLCAITTAVGFFSFIPTAYRGVSELGIISGMGMFIALSITLTALPALLIMLPMRSVKGGLKTMNLPDWVYSVPVRRKLLIQWLSLVLMIAAIALLTQVRFDFNPLNLRDPNSESVTTFKELLKTKHTSPMTLTVMVPNQSKSIDIAEKIKKLDSVEHAMTIFDLIPDNQEEKLAIFEELSLILGLQATQFPPVFGDSLENHLSALKKFQNAIKESLTVQPGGVISASLRQLDNDLTELFAMVKVKSATQQKALFEQLQFGLLDTLQDTMNSLFKGLQANYVSIEDLPEDLVVRWRSKEGIYRVEIYPRYDLNDLENLKTFIADVRKIEPHATGLPVIYLESGNAVVEAFQQALISAFLMISLVLFIVQRSFKETLLILLPLAMTAVLTGASTVVMNNPFNFANIIIIPLLFGLGVDGGIYIVHRLRSISGSNQSV